MAEIWKYLKGLNGELTKKHKFIADYDHTAICNKQVTWITDSWYTDKEGLAKRDKCKKCVSVSEGRGHPGIAR